MHIVHMVSSSICHSAFYMLLSLWILVTITQSAEMRLVCACVPETRDSASMMAMKSHWTGATHTTTKSRHSLISWMLNTVTLWCGTVMTLLWKEFCLVMNFGKMWCLTVRTFSETVYFQRCWDIKLPRQMAIKGYQFTSFTQALDNSWAIFLYCYRTLNLRFWILLQHYCGLSFEF